MNLHKLVYFSDNTYTLCFGIVANTHCTSTSTNITQYQYQWQWSKYWWHNTSTLGSGQLYFLD